MWIFFNGIDQETGRLGKGDENTPTNQVLMHRPFGAEDKYMKAGLTFDANGDPLTFGSPVNNPDYNESEQVEVELDKIRAIRQPLLDASDYALLEDFRGTDESKTKLKAYRQALRDMVNGTSTMEEVKAITFPTPPTYVEDTKWKKKKNLDFSNNDPVSIKFNGHGLATGNTITVTRSDNETGLETGEYAITVTNANNFTVPFDGDGNGGKCDINYNDSQ